MRDPVSVKLVTFSSTKSFDSHQNLNDDSNSTQFPPIRQYPEYSQNTTLSNQTSESVPNDKVTSSPSSPSHQHHQNDVDVDQNSGSPTNSISIRTVKCQSVPMTKSDLDESLVREESSSSPITKYEQILPTKICDTDDGDESCPSRYDSLYRIVHHIIFRIITFLLIITDCVLLIVDLSIPAKAGNVQSVFNFLLIVLAIIFLIEIILRVHATRPNLFFSDWYNCLDFVIVLLNLPITVICILSNDKYGRLISVVRLVRAFRLIKIIRAVLIEPKNLQKSVRQTVSENKQRYRGEGFDLDLCYVTPRVIAMSFPASGSWTLFRNNIKDVARFFNLKHGIDFYKVYNLCSEKHYDPSSFQGRVASFPIDDHNVPSLEQMIEFVKDVRNWLDQDERHIIAVHCKGGKGRTGTMICSWLIYDKQFQDPKDALAYFAERRTDLTIGKKFQGVETPSQARYVGYFSQLVNSFGGKMPEKRLLYLKSINIEGISTIGAGNGSDISCSIVIDRDEVFNFDLGTEMNCSVFVNSGEDILIITPINCPLLRGDVRMKFNCRSKKVPQEYEKCAFYFWFNTAFVYDNFFTLSREDLDNPHKKKTWKIYTEKFKVTLHFSPQSPSSSA